MDPLVTALLVLAFLCFVALFTYRCWRSRRAGAPVQNRERSAVLPLVTSGDGGKTGKKKREGNGEAQLHRDGQSPNKGRERPKAGALPGLLEGQGGLYVTNHISQPSMSLGATEHRRRSLNALVNSDMVVGAHAKAPGTSTQGAVNVASAQSNITRSESQEALSWIEGSGLDRRNGSWSGRDFNKRQYALNIAGYGFQRSVKKFEVPDGKLAGPLPVFAYRDSLDLFSRYEMKADEITIISKLGAGAFADVHMCNFRGRQCAVKVLRANVGESRCPYFCYTCVCVPVRACMLVLACLLLSEPPFELTVYYQSHK